MSKFSNYLAGVEARRTASPGPPPAAPRPEVDDAVEPAVPLRFCGICGSPREPEPAECPGCQVRLRRAASLGETRGDKAAVRSALGLYAAWIGVIAVSMYVMSRTDGSLGVLFAEIVLVTAITFGWVAASRREVAPLLRQSAPVGWFAAAVGLSLPTFAIAVGAIDAFRHLLHLHDDGDGGMARPFLDAGWGWDMVVLCVCVQPAVVEELAFRGVILGGLRRVLSPVEAVLVSAMMFAILHLSPARFPHTLAIGLAAGYLRTRTRSLYPCVALHFTHNLLAVAAEWSGHG